MANIKLLALEKTDREQFIKDNQEAYLDLLFVSPHVHSKGIGYAAWCAAERLHPEVKIWETITPYFEKRMK